MKKMLIHCGVVIATVAMAVNVVHACSRVSNSTCGGPVVINGTCSVTGAEAKCSATSTQARGKVREACLGETGCTAPTSAAITCNYSCTSGCAFGPASFSTSTPSTDWSIGGNVCTGTKTGYPCQ